MAKEYRGEYLKDLIPDQDYLKNVIPEGDMIVSEGPKGEPLWRKKKRLNEEDEETPMLNE